MNKVVVRRKHTNTTFVISNREIIMDVTLDPYGGDAKLLSLTRLKQTDVQRLRDLCDRLLEETHA